MAEASSNLRILGQYSARMLAGDYEAVREHFAAEFASHVAERVNPSVLETDIRGHEQTFWEETRKASPIASSTSTC